MKKLELTQAQKIRQVTAAFKNGVENAVHYRNNPDEIFFCGKTYTYDENTNGYDANNTTHLVVLDFDFRRIFDITYSGFLDTSGLPTQMIYYQKVMK